MAGDRDNSRRDENVPETNPFIAFRRFADSQASSLLNMVLTLPATLADASTSQRAHHQCLFGQADPDKCRELFKADDKAEEIIREARESLHRGDVQSIEKKREELMRLHEQTDMLRKQILEGRELKHDFDSSDGNKKHTDLVQKVANQKGQEWAGDWDWDWGFPEPSDGASNQSEKEEGKRRGRWDNSKRFTHRQESGTEDEEPKVWSWSFHWPPPGDTQRAHNFPSDRPHALLDEFANTIVDEVTRLMRPRSFAFWNDSYSPRALEDSEQMKWAGIPWRDAFEDLVRAEQGAGLIPEEHIGHNNRVPYNQWVRKFWDPTFASADSRHSAGQYPKRVAWEGEENEDNEEPSYEYGHDHEDQHDEPPTPRNPTRGAPFTELDAYEELLGSSSKQIDSTNVSRPSLLSTLTTTERTISPDGTVTTKVVLRKRFADGREENSESVHTERRQDSDGFTPSRNSSDDEQVETGAGANNKKTGWFWSN
jgi:hypothetical protein